ncbi:NAD(P)H-binding protein [Oerskovia sp. M15]
MIAVTAATGHLGHLVVDALLERGVARTDRRRGPHPGQGRRPRRAWRRRPRGRLLAPETLATALEGVDVVLLVSGSELGQRVQQHANVVEAAQAAGVRHFVYTSAPRATTSALIVAPEHKATEEIVAASGLTATILRNGWYSENYAGRVEQARETGVVLGSVGEGRVASASRKDYAEAAAAVLAAANEDASRGRGLRALGRRRVGLPVPGRRDRRDRRPRVVYQDVPSETHTQALLDAAWTSAPPASSSPWTATLATVCSLRRRVTWRASSVARRRRSPRLCAPRWARRRPCDVR